MKLLRYIFLFREFIVLSLLFISIEKIVADKQLAGYINPDYHIFVYLALLILFILFIFAMVFSSKNDVHEKPSGMVNYAVFIVMIIVINLPHDKALFYNHLREQRDFSITAHASEKQGSTGQPENRNDTNGSFSAMREPGDTSSENQASSGESENGDSAEHPESDLREPGDTSGETIIIYPEKFYAAVEDIFANPEKYINKKLEIVGFVYKSKKLREDRYIIARLVMWCCAADAGVAGLIFNAESTGTDFKKDEWLVLCGHIEMQRAGRDPNDAEIPVLIVESYKRIAPENPYVYPVQ